MPGLRIADRVLPLLLVLVTAAPACPVEGGVIDDGMSINQHFALRLWHRGAFDPAAGVEGVLLADNIARVPVGLGVGIFDFGSSALIPWTIDRNAAENGLWGKTQGKGRSLDHGGIIETGVFIGLDRSDAWFQKRQGQVMDARNPIVLLPGEGFGRMVRLPPAFFTDRQFATLRAFRLRTSLLFSEWFLVKGTAMSPGKPVQLAAGREACGGGVQDIALERGAARGQPVAATAVEGQAVELSLYADRLTDDGDLELRYVLSNNARPAPASPAIPTGEDRFTVVWVWQNDCSPASASIEIRDGERIVHAARPDGAEALASLLPSRDPIRIVWGECLSWRLNVPKAALADIRPGRRLDISATVTVRVATGPTAPAQAPPATIITGRTWISR